MTEQPVRIGIVTVSDRASRGEYEDLGGPALQEWFTRALASPWEAVTRLVPDETDRIEEVLKDVTPEATEAVCEKLLPGFGEQMRAVSLKVVPTAILSRQTAGIRGESLIVNLPGKPSAIDDCLRGVFPAIPTCITLIDGPWLEVNEDFIEVFRPKHIPRPGS